MVGQVIVIVEENDHVLVDVNGVKSPVCEDMLKELAKHVGTPGEITKKTEFYERMLHKNIDVHQSMS